MNIEKIRAQKGQKSAAAPTAPEVKTAGGAAGGTSAGSGPPVHPPPLYRRIDWLTFGITFLFTFIGYLVTLAPDLTLEDSGELAVGSFYAGVPHPPGYPVWTIYTWLFTVLLPVSNIAFRVAVASAVSASLACGLLGLMVSRGSSMIIEGIAEFKELDRRRENAICVVAGFVAGCLLAFNGFYWSQAVIVEVYCFGVLSLMGVLCCLLRWLYAPQQRRYLYLASFLFGICFTNHQTLLVAAMGIEVAVLAGHPKLGRNLFIINSVIYLLVMLLKHMGYVGAFDLNVPLFVVFNVIGIGSIYTAFWFVLKLDWFAKAKLILIHLGVNILIWALWLLSQSKGTFSDSSHTLLVLIFNSIGIGLLYAYYWMSGKTDRLFILSDWLPVGFIVLAWAIGAAFYFYMPLTSMTNPPMNWGYPRIWDGFIHAFTRGQYERTNPISSIPRFVNAIRMYTEGAVEEFNFVYLVFGVVPFLCFRRLQKRERGWLIGLTAIFICLGLLLLILLNPSTDKQSRDLNKVFFTASYSIVALGVGYGLTLIGCFLATQYDKYRRWLLYGFSGAAGIAVYTLAKTLHDVSYPLMVYTAIFGVVLAFICVALLFVFKNQAPFYPLLMVMTLMPIHPILSHWSDNEQHGHLFGYWFGHDMFTPPDFDKPGQFYPEMTRNAILFGGTDPGRFCPTYMIFCESFIPPSKRRDANFDRRDVYIITQNALADTTYLNYIRAHYNNSTENDAPFFQEMLRSRAEKDDNKYTNTLALAFAPVDRFFTNLGKRIEDRRRREGVYPPKEIHTPTPEQSKKCFDDYISDAQRRLVANQLEPGEDVRVIENRVQVSGQVSVMQINGLLTKIIFDENPDHEFFVEESFPLKWMYPYLTPFGIIMKINRQPVGEITEEMVKKDHEFWSLYSNRLTGNWITYNTTIKEICDFVQRTYQRMDFRNFKGDPKFVRDNDAQKAFSKLRSALAGLYAWRIDACAPGSPEAKRMFNEAEFAFKQSFSFCPYSPEAVFRFANLLARAQRFEEALMIAETCLKFDPENKGVAELISQLSGIKSGSPLAKTVPADFAGQSQIAQLDQQFRSNPSNVAAGFGLADFYLKNQQTGMAMQILDQLILALEPQVSANPSNAQSAFDLAQAYLQRQKPLQAAQVIDQLTKLLETQHRDDPTNNPVAFHLAQAYIQRQKNTQAVEILDQIIANPKVDVPVLLSAAQLYMQLQNPPKLEGCLAKLVKLIPGSAEAWFDLAALQAIQQKNAEAIVSLGRAVQLSNQRLAKDPHAKDLTQIASQDPRFKILRDMPEYKAIMRKK